MRIDAGAVEVVIQFSEQFGIEETRAFASSNNDSPPVAFRISHGIREKEILAQLGDGGGKLMPSSITPINRSARNA